MTDFGYKRMLLPEVVILSWTEVALLFSLLHVFSANCADIIMPLQ